MKNLIALVLLFLVLFVSCIEAGTMLKNVKELQKLKAAGDISEADYQKALSLILVGNESSGTNLESSQGADDPQGSASTENTIPIQINISVVKYWRAKDLVNLTQNITLTANRRKSEGQVITSSEDKLIVGFLADVSPGTTCFKVTYNPKIYDPDSGSWSEKAFSFEFSQIINGECEINKVFEFIEVKNRRGGGSVADAKFLNKDEYDALLQSRRDKEKNDKELLNKFFKVN